MEHLRSRIFNQIKFKTMSQIMLSKNLTLQECITSQTAARRRIDNTPPADVICNLREVAEHIFQPIREHFGKPIRVSSGYRSPALNKAVGGSKTSQHVKGEALDLQGTNGLTNRDIYDFVYNNLDFDQLIWEYGTDKEPAWVHVSFTKSRKNRKHVLRIK